MTFKNIVHRFFNRKPFVPVPIDPGSSGYDVYMGGNDQKRKISNNHTLVALNPVVVSISYPDKHPIENGKMTIIKGDKLLGELALTSYKKITIPETTIVLYHPTAYKNFLFSTTRKLLTDLYLDIQNLTSVRPHNVILPVSEHNKLHIYYMQPKPVVLISIRHENRDDLFPMDNIGHATEDIYLLGLRNSSPAIPKIIATQKVCITKVPFDKKEIAYGLGHHHKGGAVDITQLGFETEPSQLFGFTVPSFAIEVKEAELIDHVVCGSHTLLIMRIINRYDKNKGIKQLAHTPWFMKD